MCHTICSLMADLSHSTGVDSCNGDSGGPLFGRKGRGSLMILRGIVSYGTKRCGIGVPGVYTDVYHYITWITQNMRP